MFTIYSADVTGNPGMANIATHLGKKAGLLVLAGDVIKTAAACWFCHQLAPELGLTALLYGGLGAVLGHNWPIWYKGRGGKGVATLVGAITGIYPPVVLLCFAVWVVILMMTHYVSLASIVAGCCFPVFTIASPKVNQSVPFIVFSFVTAVLLLYTHRKNIVRLKNGTESKIYIWKPHRKADK